MHRGKVDLEKIAEKKIEERLKLCRYKMCNRLHFDDYILDLCRRLEILTDISDKDKLSYEIKTKGENLSVGERKKVALARAFAKDAEIVILDEVTAGMDSKINQEIVNEIFSEKTVIFTSHVASDIQYADRVFALQEDGTLSETLH